MLLLLLYTLLGCPLFALQGPIDPSARSFELHERRKERVEIFDFSAAFVNLEKIDIDAKRKKNVELLLSGDFPLLEKICYEGTFGVLKGALTGHFAKLEKIELLCTSCAMDLDFRGTWLKSCNISIRGTKENLTLTLPDNVGIVMQTKTGPRGRVILSADLKKQGWGIWNKKYANPLAETAPVVLTFHLETTDGSIILN